MADEQTKVAAADKGVTCTREERAGLYEIWRGAYRRCHDPRRKDYCKYGARGILMCEQWRNDFDAFAEWGMKHGFKVGMTLDRVCNNRGYSPDNCRWISKHSQAFNRRTNSYYTIDGKTRTLTEWCRIYDITADRVCHRIEAGWDPIRAITEPVKRIKKRA